MTDLSLPGVPHALAPSNLMRWVVVAAGTVAMMAGFGLTATVSLMVKPFEIESGWLRADIAFSYTLLCAGAAVGGLVTGWANDRIDTRPIAVFGALVMGAGLLAIARQTDLAHIHMLYLATGVFGFSCLYAPVIATVGLWFGSGRGLAMGIVTAGGALGQGLLPPMLQPLIATYGWRVAFGYLGVAYLMVVAPLMMFLRKPESSGRAAVSAADAPAQWSIPPAAGIAWMSVATMLCCASMAVPLVHLLALFADRGLSDARGASLILVIMLAAAVGRLAFGMAADRFGALTAYVASVLMQTVTLYGFIIFSALGTLYGLAVLFGFGFGGVMTTLLLCTRAAVPARLSGRAIAMVTLFAWLGMGLGGYQGGYCFDMTGTYAASFGSAALAGVANLLVLAGLALHLHADRRAHAHVPVTITAGR
jgi:MFS family permease